VCDAAPVSVGDRLKHARQLRGFHHGIFTPSWDAQQLFNLVGASAWGFRRKACGRRPCLPSRNMHVGVVEARAAALHPGMRGRLPTLCHLIEPCSHNCTANQALYL